MTAFAFSKMDISLCKKLSDPLMAKNYWLSDRNTLSFYPKRDDEHPRHLLWESPGHQGLGLKIIYSLTKHLFKLNCLLTACNSDNQWQDKMEKCHILEDFFQTSNSSKHCTRTSSIDDEHKKNRATFMV